MALKSLPLESAELCRLIHPRGERAERAVHRRDAPGELPAGIERWRCSLSKPASPTPRDRPSRASYSFCCRESYVRYPCFGANVQHADNVLVCTTFVAADDYGLL